MGRFDELLKRGVSPETILCCTFAKKAAEELKSRINDVSGVSAKKLTIGTFHSVASRAVKQLAPLLGIEPPNDVLNEPARRKIIADIQAANEGICKDLTFEQQRPSVILKSIDEFRERLL